MNGASSRRTVRTALFLALCLACCPLPAALASRYVTQYEQSLRDFDKSYLDNKDLYAWNVSYYMRSLAIMYEATADEKYLEILAEAIERVLAQRDDAVGDADYLGRLRSAWGTARYSTDGSSHYVWAVHTGMITYPMIRFVRLVWADERLQARWGARALEYLRAVEDAVRTHDEDFVLGPDFEREGYYVFGAAAEHGIVSGDVLPLNQQNALGLTLIELYAATGNPEYLDKASRLAHFFRNRLYRMPNGSYVWPYRADPTPLTGPVSIPAGPFAGSIARTGEDISHAAINADFIIQAYKHGIVFQREDIDALVRTVLENIFTPEGNVYSHIGGTGQLDDSYGLQVGRWLELGLYDKRVFDVIAAYYDKRPAPIVVQAYLAWVDLHWEGR
ncbi:MAG: hypothetical protein GX161_02080 [Firmicutes bacterium]|jgi:hypothetical protein|nr:hypothetical protein [Bacillota bacterium]